MSESSGHGDGAVTCMTRGCSEAGIFVPDSTRWCEQCDGSLIDAGLFDARPGLTCPEWCARERQDHTIMQVVHHADVADDVGPVSIDLYVSCGPGWTERPHLSLTPWDDTISAAEARALAASLLRAADLLEPYEVGWEGAATFA